MPATLIASRYRLGPELGRGGMGVVWEAYDELLHRTVAVKELRYPPGVADEERDKLARRTLREARAVAAVDTPHAVRVFDIVEQDGRPWIVMELLRGRTLTQVVRERGALPAAEVAGIGVALLDALGAAHRAGVLHRDVKPSNVIVGDDGRVALTDFGIATVDTDPADVTNTSVVVGSPAYMAPERARGEAPSPMSDLWSLGATLWTAAEGRPPYRGDTAFATMTAVVSEDPPTCARCDTKLDALLRRMMHRDPRQRPTLARARADLASFAGDVRPAGKPPPAFPDEPTAALRPVAAAAAVQPAEKPAAAALPPEFDRTVAVSDPRRRRRSGALLALAAAAVVGVAALVAGLMLSGNGTATPTGQRAATEPSATSSAPSSSPKASASHGSSASSPPAAATTAGLPAGWVRYTDPSVGWSVGRPASWTVDRQGGETYFRDPSGSRYLQVDTQYPAGESAKDAWVKFEPQFRSQHTGYHRIRLENVSWRDYPDVADWEFTYTSGGATLHAVDRGAVVAHRGYGLYLQTHDDAWSASQPLLHDFYASFRPRGA